MKRFVHGIGAVCVAAFLAVPSDGDAQQRAACIGGAEPAATVVGIGGTVTVLHAGAEGMLLSLGAIVCPGDRITTGPSSNVELRFGRDDTTTGASSNTTMVIPASENEPDLTVTNGMLRFISSVRGAFEIRTPVVDAGIDGTEALIVVDGPDADSLVLVREGLVTAVDRREPDKRLGLTDGEGGYASRSVTLVPATPGSVPPKFRDLLVSADARTDWAIHYPPVLLGSDVGSDIVRQAAEQLGAGEPAAAEATLKDARLPPRDQAAALSVRAVSAVFRNDRAGGLAIAEQAIAADSSLGAGHIAMSYALQADGQVEAAREAAAEAVAVAPGDPYAWARLAELELTIGHYRAASAAVERSLSLAETSPGWVIEGFLALARYQFERAEGAFGRAIEFDSNAPLPRLGLGLAKVRRGNIAAGRAELETAVALDPRRAALRTWLGRVYFEEGLPEKAAAQFRIAQEEDPEDPNAWLFAALERFAANDPVGALDLVERAGEVTEGRATVRTEAGLAEDRSVQGAGLARVYAALGFEPLATVTGAEAAELDPSSAEPHFFLADAFLDRPGFEIAQSSERLVGTLLFGPKRTPLEARLSEADLGLLQTSGPANPTFAEFAPFVTGNGWSAAASGRVGTPSSWGVESSAAMLYGPFSLSFGQFHSETDGFVRDNFIEHDIYTLQSQLEVVPELTLFGELRRRESNQGDRVIDFGGFTSPNLRQGLERDSVRAGFHFEPEPDHDFIALATFTDLESNTADCDVTPDIAFEALLDSEQKGWDVQGRYLGRFDQIRVTTGGSLSRTDVEDSDAFTVTPAFFGDCAPDAPVLDGFMGEASSEIDHNSGYAYATTELFEGLEATVGISFVDFERSGYSTFEANPKLGLRAHLTDDIVLRAAYAETVKRPLLLDDTLEPTTLAGFNQFYDDINGAEAQLVGIGVDARVARNAWLGAEAMRRWIDTPVDEFTEEGDPFVRIEDTEETTYSAYGHATIGKEWALSAEVRHQRFRTDDELSLLPPEIDTTTVPLTARWFDESGAFASLTAAYVHQSIESFPGAPGDDEDGFLLGGSIGYRIPDSRGVIALEAFNLLDEDLDIRDQSFNTPRPRALSFSRERAVFLTATFALGSEDLDRR